MKRDLIDAQRAKVREETLLRLAEVQIMLARAEKRRQCAAE